MILLVDDLRNFIQTPKEKTKLARTSKEALQILQHERCFHELWLDHDLGGNDTTIPIVDYLCELAFKNIPKQINTIYVHTANPVGKQQIIDSLTHYGYKPIPIDAQKYLTT